jgi:hypothetical protein
MDSDDGEALVMLVLGLPLWLVGLKVVMVLLKGFVVVLEFLNNSTLGWVVIGLLFCLAFGIVGALVEEG